MSYGCTSPGSALVWLKQPSKEVNYKYWQDKTALHIAAETNDIEVIQLLLANQELDVNCKDNRDWTALHTASAKNNVEAIQLLLTNQKLDTNCKTILGSTALHLAVNRNHVEAMQMLLTNQKTDVNVENNLGETVLLLETNSVATMQVLLANQRVDTNSTNNDGNTALHVAAIKDDVESIRILLAHPDFISANHRNMEGYTPAMMAEGQQKVSLRELVSHQSFDLNILDGDELRSLSQIATWFVGH